MSGWKQSKDMTRTEVQLKILHFKGITTPVLREPAAKVRDRFNELVGDIQKQLEPRCQYKEDALG